MKTNRDNSPARTKRALAERAGHRCSLCKTPTVGPSDEAPHAVTNIGIAAHITAAASGKGARRYDASLTSEQRSGIENGIWLCRACDGIVDRDEARFLATALRDIRCGHTEFARLGAQVDTSVGLVAIGPDIVARGQIIRFNLDGIVVRLPLFLQGSAYRSTIVRGGLLEADL